MNRWAGKKILAGLLAVTLVVAAVLFAAGRRDEGRLFLWRVTSPEGGRIYLTGSIHLAGPGLYPLPETFTRAFDESGSLAVEINTEALPLETMTGFIATHGLADSGRSLGDYLTPATRETLARSGLNQPEYARYKPWLAALAIQVAALERHGFSAQYGLDKHFLELAAARKLPIVELETFDEQMNLLAGLSEAEAEVFLQATLKEAADLPTLVAGFWSAWLRGDAPGFAELFFKDYNQYPELSGLMEKIITRRNHTMLERLGPLLAAPGRPRFVVIGAGHLVGPEGLLTLLAARNFQVDQLRKP